MRRHRCFKATLRLALSPVSRASSPVVAAETVFGRFGLGVSIFSTDREVKAKKSTRARPDSFTP